MIRLWPAKWPTLGHLCDPKLVCYVHAGTCGGVGVESGISTEQIWPCREEILETIFSHCSFYRQENGT